MRQSIRYNYPMCRFAGTPSRPVIFSRDTDEGEEHKHYNNTNQIPVCDIIEVQVAEWKCKKKSNKQTTKNVDE
eukprot:gene6713-4810_t